MDAMITLETIDTPIGQVNVTAGRNGLVEVALPGRNAAIKSKPVEQDIANPAYQIAQQALSEIREYLAGRRREFDLKINPSIFTPFQKRVLEITQKIPYGEIRTYGEIAQSFGSPNASRAVGMALGRNPILIILPCHRVVAANHHLTGFAAADGLRVKQWLLEMEGHKVVNQKLV